MDEANAVPDDYDLDAYDVVSFRSLSSSSSNSISRTHTLSFPQERLLMNKRQSSLSRRHSNVIQLQDNTITLFNSASNDSQTLKFVEEEVSFGSIISELPESLPMVSRKVSLTPISERSVESEYSSPY